MSNKTTETQQNERKKPQYPLIIAFSCIILLILLPAILTASFILIVSRPLAVEIGEEVDYSRITENGFVSSLCSIESTDEINTQELGESTVELTFFRHFNKKMTVTVQDTTPPAVTLYHVTAPEGSTLSPDDFIKNIRDATQTTVAFDGDAPESSVIGKHEISISVTDAEGNVTTVATALEILPESESIRICYGEQNYRQTVKSAYPTIGEEAIDQIDIDTLGTYPLQLYTEDSYQLIHVCIVDTKPPVGTIQPLALRPGQTVSAQDFLTSVTDISEVSVQYEHKPDFTQKGLQDIRLIMEDAYGNTAHLTSRLYIADIPEEITMECGFTYSEIEDEVFRDHGDARIALNLPYDFAPSQYPHGSHEFVLTGKHGTLTVKLTVKDTVKPILSLREVTVATGASINATAFVNFCTDASPVEYTLASIPSTATVGTYPVTVIATDSAGNQSEGQTSLHVIVDTVAPVIYGVKNLTVQKGGTVSYMNGVYAKDDMDGDVTVTVDSSAVNVNAEGTYAIIYYATDSSGNTATQTAYVTVSGISYTTIYQYADQILASIITPSMTPRDRAWAIFTWCKENIRYSTRTSYLMGYFVDSAYSGFAIRSGNCYVYYAVASTLLTRAGIENIQVQNTLPDSPHYWNLVKIDGNWYHLDTCPHFPGHEITAFLLTDAQVTAYSQNEVAGYYSFDPSLYPPTP